MRHLKWQLLLLYLILHLVGATAACGQWCVTDVRGNVAIRTGGSWTEAAILTTVPVAARIVISADSRLALHNPTLRRRVVLKGPVEARMLARGPRTRAISSARAAVTFAALKPGRRKRLALGWDPTQVRAQTYPVYFTYFNLSDTPTPALTWISKERIGQLEIEVRGRDMEKALLHQNLPDDSRIFLSPPDIFQLGASYQVRLTGKTATGTLVRRVDVVSFISAKSAQYLDRLRASTQGQLSEDPSNLSPLVELLGAYVEERVDGRALELIDRIIALRKDPASCRDLYLRKIKILNNRGLGEEALKVYEQYQEAVKISEGDEKASQGIKQI